jgi:hypothetical protein
MLLTGCRTVAVVEHDRPVYARSGYYGRGYSHRSPYYYSSSRPYYSRSRHYYGGDDRYYRSGYYGDRVYSGRHSRSGATIVVH